jgi:hypothetical protein
MNSNFSRQRVKCLCVALAAAAFAAPAAQARHAPGEDPATTSPRHSLPGAPAKGHAPTRWNASPLEIDRLGPKHVALQHPLSPPPTTVVKVVRPSGFDWADAGIGGGVASLTLALVAMLAMLVTRRSRRTIASERSELAGT